MIVPYRQFIPDLLELFNPITAYGNIWSAFCTLAEKYQVSDMVIRNRTENLKYEILSGCQWDIYDSISILSKKKQDALGIIVPSCYEVGLAKSYLEMA